MLLDEPLSALDETGKQEILPYLERLHHELSIPMIYVSHVVREVARLADYLVVLRDGRVVSQGTLIEQMARLDTTFINDADHGSVIEGCVVAHDDQDHLTTLECGGGQLMVGRQSLSLGERVRLYIPAADVSLTLIRDQQTSILNILPATIEEIVPQGEAQLLVRLALGDGAEPIGAILESPRLLARITRRSGRQLALQPGLRIYAQIKSVSLMRAQR
ncbi:MAG: molybdate transport system ATP-binding protein [Halothiobacillaceae bacterium]|nr:MAG: molybdate transport system ATP-binding protein [Halothiobacillaceae bacterium]